MTLAIMIFQKVSRHNNTALVALYDGVGIGVALHLWIKQQNGQNRAIQCGNNALS